MSAPRPVESDPQKEIELSIAETTPHAFAFRAWFAEPGADDWTLVGNGEGRQALTTGPLPHGSQLFVWVNVGGKPHSHYRISLTLSQDGQPLPGGESECVGTTSADGGGVCTDHVTLV